MKRVLKYGTGHVIPDGARHLQTLVQTQVLLPAEEVIYAGGQDSGMPVMRETLPAHWEPCYFVWHYYEVDVQVEEIKCIPPDDCPVCREDS